MSKVVFVGNVPYNMGEEQLIDVFKSVGQVIGFRLVFDRDSGKPKGYGFCEFADHETALSAVRNLNNQDVGGRPLRIDLADSDPFLEGKTTVRGELMDGGYPGPSEPRGGWRGGRGGGGGRGSGDAGHRDSADPEAFLHSLPRGRDIPQGVSALDNISSTLAHMPPNQLMEVLAQTKAFVITHPEHAKMLLQKHPQISYALFQSLLLNKIVDSAILERMLTASRAAAAPPRPVAGHAGMPPAPPHMGYGAPPLSAGPPAGYGVPVAPQHGVHPQHPQQHPQAHPQAPPASVMPSAYPAPGPPPGAIYATPMPVQPPQGPPAQPAYYGVPPGPSAMPTMPPAAPAAPKPAEINESQRAMLMQVLSLTPEQINALGENERAAIMQLRNQFMGLVPPA